MKIDFLKLSLTLHVALHDDMTEKVPGYVYILTNPSFREDWVKIGKSSRPVDVRSKELDNTAVPLPFEIFATMKTVKYNEVEKDDAVVTVYQNNKPLNVERADGYEGEEGKRTVKRSRFKFSMVGIKIGEIVVFEPTGTEVRVATEDSVEYEGRIYKLSPFVGTFMPEERRNTSGAYQGAKYFSYHGEILDDMRKEKEQSGK